MTIRKSKSDDLDIEGLIQKIDTDRQVEEQASAIDKRLEELRVVQHSLQDATAALNTATDHASRIIEDINATIAQLLSKNLGAAIHPDTLKALTEVTDNFVVQVGRQLMSHREKQLEQQKTHEQRITRMMESHEAHITRVQHEQQNIHEQRLADMLRKSRGLWISHTWLKALTIIFILYSLLVILYVKLGN